MPPQDSADHALFESLRQTCKPNGIGVSRLDEDTDEQMILWSEEYNSGDKRLDPDSTAVDSTYSVRS
jgi:hypothetical protein